MTTTPETELADRVMDVAERPETSLADRDVLYAAAEGYDELRARLANSAALIGELKAAADVRYEQQSETEARCFNQLQEQEKQLQHLQNVIADLNARLYGIALLLKH
jgi:hypothetical protein